MNTELDVVATQVEAAADYLALFGDCSGNAAKQGKHVTKIYRRLARVLHPDGYHDPVDQGRAHGAFVRLQQLLEQAEEALDAGVYGQPVALAVVQSRRAEHTFRYQLAHGDIGTVYAAQTVMDGQMWSSVCKVARSPGDRDLMQTEAAVLRRLRGPDTDSTLHPFVPALLDSFAYAERGKPNRQVNVLEQLCGFYTLEQVRQAFSGGLDPLHMVWIWRRVLTALRLAHDNAVVHGAVVPAHIMILPEQHGVVLVDWCYASVAQDDWNFPPIKAVAQGYQDWYPEEVLTRQSPSPATDIAMAARCMVYIMGGDPVTGNLPERLVPKPLRAFLRGCLGVSQSGRPQDAWRLLGEFDELLAHMGGPYFPRRFRPFTMPTGVV